MPRILEMKEIDGALWVKVDLTGEASPVSLYTADEVTKERNRAIEECAMAVDESRTEDQWNVDAHQTRFSILKTIRDLKS